MVAPVFESTTPFNASSANIRVDMPATRPADDFYLAVGAHDDDDHTPYVMPSTFVALVDTDLDAGSATHLTAWKKGAVGEPASHTFNGASGGSEPYASAMLRYSGQDLTDPIGAVSTVNFGVGTTATALAVTAEQAESLIFRVYVCDTTFFTDESQSAGDQRARSEETAGGQANYIVIEEASPGASTTTGTATVDLDASDDWSAYTFELLPAAGATNDEIAQARSLMRFVLSRIFGRVN